MLEIQCEQLVGQNRMKDFFRSSESMLAAPVCVCAAHAEIVAASH